MSTTHGHDTDDGPRLTPAERRLMRELPPHWRSPVPPRWLPRALLMIGAAVFLGLMIWRAAGLLGNVITIVVISWFIALAMEPLILWLGRHGIRRTWATGITMIGGLLVAAGMLALMGGLFINQLVDLVQSVPAYYRDLSTWLDDQFGVTVPGTSDLITTISGYGDEIGTQVIGVTTAVAGTLFTFTAVLLVVYYMASQGPKFRAAVCRYLAPHRQREVLRIWELSQDKVAGFINSRMILAAFSTVATFLCLTLLGVPYALPLAVFTGLVSQFVPTVGTYIGGAAPVLVALAVDPIKAVIVLVFIVAYQQVENLILTPKVSQRSLQLNPAVAFLSVLAFGALFGALGAILALPVVATIQAVASTYLRRHELIESELLAEEPVRRKKDDEAEPDPATDQA